jgi:pimeloyl-ACP methyl ester carboxylesterase
MKERTEGAAGLANFSLMIARQYCERLLKANSDISESFIEESPGDFWKSWFTYSTDFIQRSVLFWDTIRKRGDNWIEHELKGKPPVLAFDYEIIMDARQFEKPVNYALLRIIPPKGTKIDEKKRPFIIIDPRAGHGPGIGGSKKDSEIGVALKGGHQVYFVSFFPMPMPGQRLPDITAAEVRFVEEVVKRHPQSPKPVILGNCQGGWAAMLVAASSRDFTGAVVMNGAPLAYWSGSEGKNPMRYAGGLLGGAWTALLASDIGHGIFDGAHLVDNFEHLNPANTLWSKYYHLFSNIDTEEDRFLDFEKWWGGFYLMNEDEIHWILDNLFIGNKLVQGQVEGEDGRKLDLKSIRSPIIVFASMGDNITPPEQAFDWITDIYGSTEEIKANGQVIVVLMHQDIGHLGIFVSGKVAQKEHTEIVELIDQISMLVPGLYAMEIKESKDASGKPVYDVDLKEISLDEITCIDRDGRMDELPFKAVKSVSDFNELVYTIFGRPMVRAFVNDQTAWFSRMFHPLRLQRWAFSSGNPFMWGLPWLSSLAGDFRVEAQEDNEFLQEEKQNARRVSSFLDYYRDLRDAGDEALFYQIYAPLLELSLVNVQENICRQGGRSKASDLPKVKETIEKIDKGGYAEAMARINVLLTKASHGIPLHRLEAIRKLMEKDKAFTGLSEDEVQRIHAEQAVMVEFAPGKALETLPLLLRTAKDRKKALAVMDEAERNVRASGQRKVMLKKINDVLR